MWILFVDYVFFLDFVDKINMKYDVFRYILNIIYEYNEFRYVNCWIDDI